MNWRKIPHPHYGNWGGGHKRGPEKPIDRMDSYFRKHDILLKNAQNKHQRIKSDKILIKDLKRVENSDLKYPVYGKLYKYGCILIFTVIVWMNS